MPAFETPSLNVDDQIRLLRNKGLTITSTADAHRWLSHVSYYRLKHYTNKFKDPQTGQFVYNSTFEQLISVYLFDRDLKFILFDAIEIIEVALKTLISNTMADKHGPHWYMERTHFQPTFAYDALANLHGLIGNNMDIDYRYMGFTENWQHENVWR